MSSRSFCDSVLNSLRDRRSPRFSGAGIVFYRHLRSLPRIDLGDTSESKPALPVVGAEIIAQLLAQLSDFDSLWHDGFHLVDVEKQALTHLSQFLSPSLDSVNLLNLTLRPFGARQMTSLLVSELDGIERIGLVAPAGGMSYFENGKLRTLDPDR